VGDEARERTAALELLLGILADLVGRDPTLTLASVRAELDRRDAAEAAAAQDGVNLLTYHRAKGLEWDAVFLPSLEEGLLPVRQAKDEDAIAEERRLLYVGVTRARRYLTLSWAARRVNPGGRATSRQPSRFLVSLAVRSSQPVRLRGRRVDQASAFVADPALLGRLQAWRRERAQRDGVPAYVVAEDATLAAIAEAQPRSVEALHGVRGIGPVRLERYGAEILTILERGA
jgi:DNA helicase-2/ATP-dependent DNA helicase PcrA